MNEKVYKVAWYWLVAMNLPLFVVAALVSLLLTFPSGSYIKPVLWAYDEASGVVTFARKVERGVTAKWIHEIITADGLQCSDSGQTFYEVAPGDVVMFPAPEPLLPCLKARAYKQKLTWQVLLFDIIPLPPVTLEQSKP